MSLQLLPFDRTRSTVAARAAWVLDRYLEGVLLPEEVIDNFAVDELPVVDWLRMFVTFHRPIDEVTGYEERSSTRAVVRVVVDGMPMSLHVKISDSADARVRQAALMHDAQPGVIVREARDDDGPALADLERRCPVVSGDTSTTYDRGDDYFAQQRLMGSHMTSVAEVDGRIVGVFSDSIRRVRVGDRDMPVSYRYHLRVDPACRGMHILPALNAMQGQLMLDRYRPRPNVMTFVACDNQTMLDTADRRKIPRWSMGVERLVIDCAANAAPPAGRPAAPSDVNRLASLLYASHGNEVLAPVFDADHLNERFLRSPRDYWWTDVMVGERAAVGVWDQRLRVTATRGDDVTRSVRATAIDWGCESGAEDELLALLRGWCGRLLASGSTHLVLYTSAPSPGRRALDELGPEVDDFLLGFGVDEPAGTADRGIYVDPIYF